MIIPFIWGIFIGVISGVAAVIYWVVTPGKKVETQVPREIEKPESNQLDITLELVMAAYNVLRQFCKQREKCNGCPGCPLEGKCAEYIFEVPACWPELEAKHVQKQ